MPGKERRRELGRRSARDAALGALGGATGVAVDQGEAFDKAYKNLVTPNKKIPSPPASAKAITKRIGKGALTGAALAPLAGLAIHGISPRGEGDPSTEEEYNRYKDMAGDAATGAIGTGAAAGGGMIGRKAIQNRDIIKDIARTGNTQGLSVAQKSRMGDVMSNKKVRKYTAGAGLLGGLAGLGYSALKGDSGGEKSEPPENTIPDDGQKGTGEYGDKGLKNTIPTVNQEQGPRVKSSNPTAYSY